LQQTLIEIAPDRSRAENEQILLVVTRAAQAEQRHLDCDPVDGQYCQIQSQEDAEKLPRHVDLFREIEETEQPDETEQMHLPELPDIRREFRPPPRFVESGGIADKHGKNGVYEPPEQVGTE